MIAEATREDILEALFTASNRLSHLETAVFIERKIVPENLSTAKTH